jgi:hypothetical protein
LSIRKIILTGFEDASRICLLRGLAITEGEVSYTKDSAILHHPLQLDKGRVYTIELPHFIKVDKGVILVALHDEILPFLSSALFPTTLSVGYNGRITVNLKARESGLVDRILKLHMVELSA